VISIVGNIKINDLQRLKYLKATLWSFEILKEYQLLLNIDCDCITLDEITVEVEKIGFKNYQLSNESGNYGEIYCKILDLVSSDYVINFFEDHYLLLDDKNQLESILMDMKINKVDVCKSSFWQIEQNSKTTIYKIQKENCIFINDLSNFNQYQKYYGSRYYIGVNFITTLEFAKRFWNRKFNSNRPHEWEIAKFSKEFEYICMLPDIEIMCAIDDEHGEIGTSLLERKEYKFWNIYNNL
jgi:hypothetical protein